MHSSLAFTVSFLAVSAPALAQVVVVDVPQIAGSTRYSQANLSSNGSFAVFTTDEGTGARVVRWDASTNTLLVMVSLGFNSQPNVSQVTNIGSVAGFSPTFNRGAVWLPSGNLATDPPGVLMGIPANASKNGAPYFIVDSTQSTMYSWNAFSSPLPLGKPAGSTNVRPADVNATGTACAVSALIGGLGRAHRWRSGIGYDAIPLLPGMTENFPLGISDDGSRVVGTARNAAMSYQGFFWSVETGLVSMGFPSGALVLSAKANDDCSLVCGSYLVDDVTTHFVWSLHEGLMTANAFANLRGYNPGTTAFAFSDFNATGSAALVKLGNSTKLLKNLYRAECGVSGNCFAPHATPGCVDASCCDRVCAADPFCCNSTWDAQCVEEAEALCRTGAACTDPRRVTPFVASSYDYNTGLDGVPSDESSCGKGDSQAVWRVFRAPCTGAVTIDTCTEFAEGPIVLSVYSSCGTEIACSEGAFVACGATRANIAFSATAGVEYRLRIGSIGGGVAGNIAIACEATCGAPGATSCTVPGAGTGCSDSVCCGTVCINDPYCCDIGWDSQCANEARIWCYRPGDFDFDGDIDAADLASILTNWGLPGVTDIDGDGFTGAGDLSTLLANWG
jgi:hypothetical protein